MARQRDAVVRFMCDNGLRFNNQGLIDMALTHPSFSQEKNCAVNNQRLEFLGDAVLNMIVAEYLYNHFNAEPEGELTKIRARVVCEKALLNVANSLRLGEYLLLGRGEEMSGGRKRRSILADAVEAVIGAIYLDQGYEAASRFVLANLQEYINETAQGDYQDYKSRLQELVQGKNKQNVSYQIIKECGPAHAKVFEAGVFYRDRLLAAGQGRSKKEAEQNAAEKVLRNRSLLLSLGLELPPRS
jgi:ribonuclease-3